MARRTSVINQIRAFLLERGIGLAKSPIGLREAIPEVATVAGLGILQPSATLLAQSKPQSAPAPAITDRTLGKDAAAFLPTGTLANNLGIRLLAGENRHVFVQEQSHLYRDESDSAQVLGGLNLVPLGYNKSAPTFHSNEQVATSHCRIRCARLSRRAHGNIVSRSSNRSVDSPEAQNR